MKVGTWNALSSHGMTLVHATSGREVMTLVVYLLRRLKYMESCNFLNTAIRILDLRWKRMSVASLFFVANEVMNFLLAIQKLEVVIWSRRWSRRHVAIDCA